ncbi:MAG: M50 family metallopeptidase [Clostridia bacterium]|nr:M50 family metallopeptidase [Clostridia bacterium]
MRLFCLAGISFSVNPFFLGMLALFALAGLLGQGLLAFGVVLLHELAHIGAAYRLGLRFSEIELLPFGGVAKTEEELALDPGREALVALAGPASNFLLIALAWGGHNYHFWSWESCRFFWHLNLSMAVFNLLPLLPLDGGRIYRAGLAGKVGLKKATLKAAVWGQAGGLIIAVLGIVGLILKIWGLEIFMLGAFLFYAAGKEKKALAYLWLKYLLQKEQELERAKMLPAFWGVVGEQVVLGEIVQNFLPRRFNLVLVNGADCRIKGMVGENKLLQALQAYGYNYPVGRLLE